MPSAGGSSWAAATSLLTYETMAALENALMRLARDFAHDLVSALRGARVEDVVGATHSITRPRRRTEYARESQPRISIEAAIADTARAYRLNGRETAILKLATRGETRSGICRALGANENTLKTQARGLLRKVGTESPSDAAIAVLHRAIGSSAVVLAPPDRASAKGVRSRAGLRTNVARLRRRPRASTPIP
jgi:DNA-binding NarL/FixJ family response regulator